MYFQSFLCRTLYSGIVQYNFDGKGQLLQVDRSVSFKPMPYMSTRAGRRQHRSLRLTRPHTIASSQDPYAIAYLMFGRSLTTATCDRQYTYFTTFSGKRIIVSGRKFIKLHLYLSCV